MTHPKRFIREFADSVDAELAEVAANYPYLNCSKSQLVKTLRSYRKILDKNRCRIQKIHGNGGSGIEVCTLLTMLLDRFIFHIAGIVCSAGHECVIAALGGYGRNELNPYSDIDLLFLVENDQNPAVENEISAFIQFLWDMNLDIGHSIRTAEQCIDEAKMDMTFATTLLEGRFLAGNHERWDNLMRMYKGGFLEKNGTYFAMLKIKERNERLSSFGSTVQVQIPNVKESPGGLRDIHTSRWLSALSGRGAAFDDLYKARLLLGHELVEYEKDFEFLLRVRNAMHFVAGKKTDVLEYLTLPHIAQNLGYSGTRTRYTEQFMREYYMRAGRIFRLTGHIIGRFLSQNETEHTRSVKTDPSGLLIVDGKADFPPDAEKSFYRHPEQIIRIFTLAAGHNIEITERATAFIERSIEKFSGDFPKNPAVRDAFYEMLTLQSGIGKAFRLMHEHGVLIKLIPEFGAISWHFQYNFYHAYTTDEHSVRVVENLEKMSRRTLYSLPELSDIMTDVTAKSALYLAGILHDIGKGKGKSHSARGERMAAKALVRLGFDDRTIDLVRFLIREHLTMSHISQRRDMEDIETIRDLVTRVGSAGRLRMLTLLTFADLLALSDDALTDWKKALLMSLYNKTMRYLDKGFEKLSGHSGEALIEKVINVSGAKISKQTVRDHIRHLPEQYTLATSPAHIREHLHGIDVMKRHGVWSSITRRKDISLLTVITKDYSKALSDICGTITTSDINILGAQIFTRSDGIIIDTFLVADIQGKSTIPKEVRLAFKRNIRAVISGKIPVTELIDLNAQRWKRRKQKAVISKPRIVFHNDVSSKYTVIDIFTIDYIGLLYDITSILASFNIDIHTAKVGTDEDQIADAFYVRESGGGKIEDKNTIREITAVLTERLNRAIGRSSK